MAWNRNRIKIGVTLFVELLIDEKVASVVKQIHTDFRLRFGKLYQNIKCISLKGLEDVLFSGVFFFSFGSVRFDLAS